MPLGQSGMQVDDDAVLDIVLDGMFDDVLLSNEEVMLLVSEEAAVYDSTELVIEPEVESELVLEARDDSVLLMSDDVALEVKLLETEEDSILLLTSVDEIIKFVVEDAILVNDFVVLGFEAVLLFVDDLVIDTILLFVNDRVVETNLLLVDNLIAVFVDSFVEDFVRTLLVMTVSPVHFPYFDWHPLPQYPLPQLSAFDPPHQPYSLQHSPPL